MYILYTHTHTHTHTHICNWDVTRSRGTRSRESRLVSRERDDILAKYFYNVYIRASPLMVKNCACDLDSNTHVILILNDNDSAMSIKTVSHRECQWSVRSKLCHYPCKWIRGSAIITLPMWTLSFTDMGGNKTCAAQAPLTLAMWNRC